MTQNIVNVNYGGLTPAERAKVQAQVHAAMAQINYKINSPQAGGMAQGVFVGKETKQPQDKVLRLVTSRWYKKAVVTSCVIWTLYICFNAVLLGYTLKEKSLLGFVLSAAPLVLGVFFFWYWVRRFFKEAEARADLLDWPQK